MSRVKISYLTREFCRERLLNATSGFNFHILQAARDYRVEPFMFSEENLYFGRMTLADVSKSMDRVQLPCAVLSIARSDAVARSASRITPTVFSGVVLVSLDIYVMVPGTMVPVDAEGVFFAVEESIINSFNYQNAPMPDGLSYNNEIVVEQGKLEWATDSWIQHIPVSLVFSAVVW